MLYKVIVTQDKVKRFLLENNLIEEEKIAFIYGLPVSKTLLNIDTTSHQHYGIKNKINLNICFVAYKYSEQGKDKGYDTFIEVAKKLRTKYNDIYFHVVGNFDESDIDVTELDERIAFYGVQDTKCAFDGFPTGCTTEAMLNEVAAIVTDPLNLNTHYIDDEDIIIVRSIDDIIMKVEELKNNPKKLFQIATKGYKKANEIYSYKNQINKRIQLLNEIGDKRE